MAAKNAKSSNTLEGIDKLPSNTLKRHPNSKMDLNKNDLLRLLSYLEGELQARDVVIATLKAEKTKQLLYQAKYGRFGLGDPFQAMQRDSDGHKDNSFDESAIKAMYDNQLVQLENLIDTQRKAQRKMQEQLICVEKRYHKCCSELEDEKHKHAQDTAQGDDVTYALEKERERLRQQLDFEKTNNKKLEKDLKKTTTALEEERAVSGKHKKVAMLLINERKRLAERMLHDKARNNYYEHTLQEEQNKMKNISEGLLQETKKSLQMEAAMEKQLAEIDTERAQWQAKLERAETRTKEQDEEIEKLREELSGLQKQLDKEKRGDGPQSIEIRSSVANKVPMRDTAVVTPMEKPTTNSTSTPAPSSSAPTPAKTKPKIQKMAAVRSRSPDRELPPKPVIPPAPDSQVKRITQKLQKNAPAKTPEKSPPASSGSEVESGGAHVRVVPVVSSPKPGSGASERFTIAPGGTTVFTTPTGGKISFHVAPSGGNQPRKPNAGRGTPPPVPPNKPQYIPQPGLKREGIARAASPRSEGTPIPIEVTRKPTPPSKLGVQMARDNGLLSPDISPNDYSRQITSQLRVNSSSPSPTTNNIETAASLRKATQFSTDAPLDSSEASDSSSSSTSPNMDFFGPEMADLQQLLVSMASGESSSSSVESSASSTPDVHTSPLHKHAACGDLPELRRLITEEKIDVNTCMKDGTTAVHAAAESGHEECLKYLLENGGNPNALRDDNFSPLLAAAGEGHYGCLCLLLSHKANVQQPDRSGWTALYWASTNGHSACCKLLLDQGARLDTLSNANWTPVHAAVHAGHVQTIETLLSYPLPPPSATASQSQPSPMSHGLISMADKDGWTIAHLAAIKETKDCLEVIAQHCKLDLERRDKWGRTVYEVASKACKDLLNELGNKNERICSVYIEVDDDVAPGTKNPDSFSNIGTLKVDSTYTWSLLEECLSDILVSHFKEVALGLRTKKTSRLESDSPEAPPYNLGLSMDSVKYYSIGHLMTPAAATDRDVPNPTGHHRKWLHRWSPGTPSENTPFEILCNNDTNQIAIKLFGWEDTCQDTLSYETLIPVATLQNYLRLIEQYKNIVFYGPGGTGKTYLARRLAQCVKVREQQHGNAAQIYFITLNSNYSRSDLVQLLTERGCLFRVGTVPPLRKVPILVFDDLSRISISDIFSDILPALEHRGPQNAFRLNLEGKEGDYFLVASCYIVGTMDRTRSTGLELSIQQRFRWVHFRIDTEPMKGLLARHLFRRLMTRYDGQLPPPDDAVYRAVEWVICVWQRLNDGLGKLGLPELVFGPSHFLSCPVEVGKPKSILRWLSLLWNHAIAPSVSDAVIRGSGSDTASQGQQKVANTALYVLMQRAIVSGCPLTGQEKERYLSSFHGSNELDIQMRGKIRPASSASSSADSSDESEANNLTPMKRPSTEALRRMADQPTITMPASTVESSHLSAVRRENNVSPQPMQRIQRYESDMGEDIWEIAPPGHTPMPQGITKRVVEYRGTANMNNKLRNDFFRAMSSSPTPRGQHSSEEQQKSG